MKRNSRGMSSVWLWGFLVWEIALSAGIDAASRAHAQVGGGTPNLQEESPQPPGAVENELDRLLFEAEANNPGLMAAYFRWQGAREMVPQASSLMDPEVLFTDYLRKNRETEHMNFELEVMQMFPYPGKRPLRGKAASEDANAMEQEFLNARLTLRREVKDAYYEFYYLEQSIRITAENLELLKHFERVANARYEVNQAGSQDVLKAQVELGELENELRALEDFRGPVRARLNAALNRPPFSLLPSPAQIDLREAAMESEQVLDLAFRHNPELKALDARIRKQQTEVELARKEYFPDFGFGLEWENMDQGGGGEHGEESMGGDVLMGMVRFNLPIYRDRLAAGVRQAEHGVREAENEKSDAENRLAMELQTALYRLRNAKRQIDLFSGSLIPKARQSVLVTQTAYSAEEAGFLDLIDAERVLLTFQNSYHRSVADYGQALAEIEALVGRSVVDGDSPSLTIPEIKTPPLEEPPFGAGPETPSPSEASSLGR